MNLLNTVPSSRVKASFRLELVSMVFIAVLSVVLVCLFDTGWLAQWLANHKGTKIDEIVFIGIGLLVVAGFFTLRRWLSLSQFLKRYNGAVELSPEISRVKQAQQKDLFRIALASAVSVVLVFLFDTGSIAEWIAQHKDSKIDETIVTGVILLVGLLFFSIRRWFEYTEQVLRYEELHRKTTELNREIKLMSEIGESLQSCLSVEEAHQLITTSAQVLFPGSSGAVCIIANSRDIVEVLASWGESRPSQNYFEPKYCLALRRGRLHRVELDAPGLSCTHFGEDRHVGSLCVPMIAHGETMGLLYVSPRAGDGTTPGPNEQASSEERLARRLAEQSALALANLSMRDALRMQSIRGLSGEQAWIPRILTRASAQKKA